MTPPIILASGSTIRSRLLQNACVPHRVEVPRLDEDSICDSLVAEGAAPHDIAGTLAAMKAGRIAARHPSAFVIGCDQVLDLDGRILSKPASPDDAIEQLRRMAGKRHALLSAVVVQEGDAVVWRHVGRVAMTMHAFSEEWLAGYVARNWDSIRHSVGAYKLEEEGVRLFARIEGDYFSVLGLPLVELLSYLTQRGILEK